MPQTYSQPSGKPGASGTFSRGSGARGWIEPAQRSTRVLPEAPNEFSHRLALGDGLPHPASTRLVLSTPVVVTARPTRESHAAKPVAQPSP
jgi:hypothetical protein